MRSSSPLNSSEHQRNPLADEWMTQICNTTIGQASSALALWPAKSKLEFRQYQGESSLVRWIQHFLVPGMCVCLSLFLKLGGQSVKVNHTLSMLHGRAASHNATATPSIADQYVSDHLYDYLCMSKVVPWRDRRWIFDGSWAGRKE